MFKFVQGVASASGPVEGVKVKNLREDILKKYTGRVFKDRTGGDPPVRGPLCEAGIKLRRERQPRSRGHLGYMEKGGRQ